MKNVKPCKQINQVLINFIRFIAQAKIYKFIFSTWLLSTRNRSNGFGNQDWWRPEAAVKESGVEFQSLAELLGRKGDEYKACFVFMQQTGNMKVSQTQGWMEWGIPGSEEGEGSGYQVETQTAGRVAPWYFCTFPVLLVMPTHCHPSHSIEDKTAGTLRAKKLNMCVYISPNVCLNT